MKIIKGIQAKYAQEYFFSTINWKIFYFKLS